MIHKIKARAALILLGTAANVVSASIPCMGARQVVFYEKGTNAQSLGSTSIEVSMDNTNWQAAAGAAQLAAVAPAALVLGPFNAGGVVSMLYPQVATTHTTALLLWRWCRKKWSGLGATPANDITAFECDAWVYGDDGIWKNLEQPAA